MPLLSNIYRSQERGLRLFFFKSPLNFKAAKSGNFFRRLRKSNFCPFFSCPLAIRNPVDYQQSIITILFIHCNESIWGIKVVLFKVTLKVWTWEYLREKQDNKWLWTLAIPIRSILIQPVSSGQKNRKKYCYHIFISLGFQ